MRYRAKQRILYRFDLHLPDGYMDIRDSLLKWNNQYKEVPVWEGQVKRMMLGMVSRALFRQRSWSSAPGSEEISADI